MVHPLGTLISGLVKQYASERDTGLLPARQVHAWATSQSASEPWYWMWSYEWSMFVRLNDTFVPDLRFQSLFVYVHAHEKTGKRGGR